MGEQRQNTVEQNGKRNERLDRIVQMIRNHPAISTRVLQEKLYGIAMYHDAEEQSGSAAVPMCEIDACIMISLLREVLAYRNKYGLITLPFDAWPFEQS